MGRKNKRKQHAELNKSDHKVQEAINSVEEIKSVEDIEDYIRQADTNAQLEPYLPIILHFIGNIIFRINSFENKIENFIANGPDLTGDQYDRNLLLPMYQVLSNNKGNNFFRATFNKFFETISDNDDDKVSLLTLKPIIEDIIKSLTNDTIIKNIQRLLLPQKADFSSTDLNAVIAKLSDKKGLTDLEIVESVKNSSMLIVQLFSNDSKNPDEKCYLIPIEEHDSFLELHKPNASLIKVYVHTFVITDYVPSKEELIECLKIAIKNNDTGFLQLCRAGDKLVSGILDDLENSIELLWGAYKKNDPELMKLLINYKLFGFGPEEVANINKLNDAGITALMQACNEYNIEGVKRALAMGADVSIKDKDGSTALMYLAKGKTLKETRDNINIIKNIMDEFLFNKKERVLTAQEELERKVILSILSHYKSAEDLIFNLSKGGKTDQVDVIINNRLFGFSPEEVANINKLNAANITPLMKACSEHDLKSIKKLLVMKADLSIKDADGLSAISYLIKGKSREVILQNSDKIKAIATILFDEKSNNLTKENLADKELLDIILAAVDKSVDIHYAIFETGRVDLLERIIDKSLFNIGREDINKLPQEEKNRLLRWACVNNDVKSATFLLAFGANSAALDENGKNALMLLAEYSEDQILEVNKPTSEQSPEIKAIKEAKNIIAAALLKNSSLDLNAKDRNDKTVLNILVKQGMVKGERDGTFELRGDHGLMEKLIAAGADPILGNTELSFKMKTLITLGLSIGLTSIKNIALNLIALGFIGRILFTPVDRLIGYALDAVIGYKAYLDAKNPLYLVTRTFLDNEYAADTLLNMDKKIMIGSFHINAWGKLITGQELKSELNKYSNYRYVDNAYYEQKDLPKSPYNKAQYKIIQKDQLEMMDTLLSRYHRLHSLMQNPLYSYFYKARLEATRQDMIKAYKGVDVGFVIPDNFNGKLSATFAVENHANLIKEISNNNEHKIFFYKIYAAIKNGSVRCGLETRYNLELFEHALRSADSKLVEASIIKPIFADFAKFCNSIEHETDKDEKIYFDEFLKINEYEFRIGVAKDTDRRTALEKGVDLALSGGRAALNVGADGVAYAAGTTRGRVFHHAADAISTVGATANAGAHIAFREFIDSWWLLPTAAAFSLGYAIYRWPEQMKKGIGIVINAVVTTCLYAYAAASFIVGNIVAGISFVGEQIEKGVEFTSHTIKNISLKNISKGLMENIVNVGNQLNEADYIPHLSQ